MYTDLKNVQHLANNAPYVTNCTILQRFVTTNVNLLSRTNKFPTVKMLQRREFMFLIRKTIFQWQRLNHGVSESSWLATVSTEGGKITFKLDTGAEASVLPLKVHKRLNNRPVIEHTTITLSAYGGSVIKSAGTCTLKCKGKISSPVTFYVVSIAA